MKIVVSKDGTRIAYDKTGQGPSLILVAGAFQDRMAMSAYAEPLSVAHTLVNDATIMEGTMRGSPLPADRWKNVRIPTLVIYGGEGPAWSHNAAEALVKLLPHAERHPLEGQFHTLTPDALTPVLEKFFLA